MSVPAFLPDWVPPWVQLALLVGLVLVVGAYAVMPFSVFGVKARLDALDERLDEMRSDIRALANRLPDPEMGRPAAWRRGVADDEDFPPATAVRRDRPPVPPVAERGFERERDRATAPTVSSPVVATPVVATPVVAPPVVPPARPRRSEPQLNWPENRPRG